MKYTRYNVKPKKNNNNRILPLIIVMIIATVFTYLLINKFDFKKLHDEKKEVAKIENVKNKKYNNKKSNIKEDDDNNKVAQSEKSEIIFIPCGVFKIKENADKIIKSLYDIGCPFSINEGGLTKIYYGIVKSSEEYEKEAKKLSDMKVENSKNIIEIQYKDLSMAEIAKIIEAEIEIINSVKSPTIESVKTGELKKWVNELEKVNEKTICYEEVKKMKEHINSLPNEVSKKEAEEMSIYIYNVVKEIEKSKK